ncbi:MAG TPA: methyltransferase domain-containing protein [Thermoplasmata archaeon]|jgi:ubiquinone/menaquinone biosynthesis C-methylase UbiE
MPWKYSEEYYREYTRATWNETAWEYLGLMKSLEPFGFDLVNRLDLHVREKVLDLATGPGEPAMSIARIVGAEGEVVGVDLSEKMVNLARNIAKERRIPNVRFEVMDAEHLAFPDETFDAVSSRFGFQIFTNPEGVAKEAFRVLRRKGRIGVSVWSTADKATAIHMIVGPMLEFAEPDETGYLPTPYELGGSGEMVRFLEAAGFHDVREERRTHSMHFRDADDYLDVLLNGTPLGHSLREEDASVQEKVLAKTRENLKAWTTRAGISIPCECVVATARR